ncbi:MAG: hypothetical protein P8Y66_01125 [Nitrospirota bacterium]|jgi:hypothetical protein
MSFWDRIKEDVFGGFDAVRKRAGVLTEEGKRRYRAFELKSRAHRLMSELGGRTYTLLRESKDPREDATAMSLVERLKKLESQIGVVEPGKPKAARKRAAPKKARPRKKAVKKAAPKKRAARKKTTRKKTSSPPE